MTPLTLGIDLATASARCVALDTATGRVVAQADSALSPPERQPGGVSRQSPTYAPVALELVRRVCLQLGPDAARVAAVSVTGTSGTVVPVDRDGAAVGAARLYDDTASSDVLATAGLTGASSLGRMVALRRELPAARWASTPDVVNAALAGQAVSADTSHWLKAGIDLAARRWPVDAMSAIGLDPADLRRLPELVLPGTRLGTVNAEVARTLGVPESVRIVAGMTDGCTAQIAAGAVHDGDTMGVLGTTLVLKAVSETPVESADGAVYSHLAPDGHYWAGGASNAGAGILAVEFAGEDLAALDRRVAETVAGVRALPPLRCGRTVPGRRPQPAPADRRRTPEPARRIPCAPRRCRVRRTPRSRTAPAARRHPTPSRHRRRRDGQPGLEPDPGHRPRTGRPGQRRPVRQQQRRRRDPRGLRALRPASDRDRRPSRTLT